MSGKEGGPKVEVRETSAEACKYVAAQIAKTIREKVAEKGRCVLGLATGATQIPVYQELVRLHKEEGLSFKDVISFNLDEYNGLAQDHPESYHFYMRSNLFDHVDILPGNFHLPSGTVAPEDAAQHCADYENAIRSHKVDLQLLGIGRDGHIGFNEPGSEKESQTRVVELHHQTIADAASSFGGEEGVPKKAITMGIDTILSNAAKVILLAWGPKKAQIIQQTLEATEVSHEITATFLRFHSDVEYVLDRDAASKLQAQQ